MRFFIAFILTFPFLVGCAQQRKKKEAESYYKKAHEITLNTTHNALSHRLTMQAMEFVNRAIALNPTESRYYRVKGTCYFFLKEYDSAIVYHDRAIQWDSANLLAWMGKGIAYENSRRFIEAEGSYQHALAIDPEYPSIYFNLAMLYDKWEKDSLSIVYYTRAIEREPEQESNYLNSGHVKLANRMYESAMSDFNRALSLDPNNKLAYNNRGLCKYYLGKYQDAIVDYKMALSIKLDRSFYENFDTDKYSVNNIANACYALGNKKEACAYWQRAIRMGYKYDTAWKREYNIDDPAELVKRYCK